MAVDRYTKTVLTVMAGCLVWLCAVGGPRAVAAQSLAGATPVVLVGTGTMARDGSVIVHYGNSGHTELQLPVVLAAMPSQPIPVTLPYTPEHPLAAHLTYSAGTPLPVEITAVQK